MSIKKLIKSKLSREFILYALFGIGTTAVDYAVSFLLYRTELNIHIANIFAWVAAVVFAYITNKIFVFRSKTGRRDALVLEIVEFFGGRLLTLALQELIVVLLYDILGINQYIVKVVASVIVIIINYIICRIVVFKKGDDGDG